MEDHRLGCLHRDFGQDSSGGRVGVTGQGEQAANDKELKEHTLCLLSLSLLSLTHTRFDHFYAFK